MMRSRGVVVLILFVFFVISFLTNILGPLIPNIIESFELSIGMAGFLPFSFFVAYGVMSIPAGIAEERLGEKKMMVFAFLLAAGGAMAFALLPRFSVALPSLFVIGIGMAVLQVVINPLLRVAGGEEQFAFNSVLAQLFFGAASFLSPMLYSYLVTHVHVQEDSPAWLTLLESWVPPELGWVSIYWIFGLISLLMVAIVGSIRIPSVQLREEERIEVGSLKDLVRNKQVVLFFLATFCYVGTEQGVANWASKFLQDYHQVDPNTLGAMVISRFWGLMTLGCLLGLLLLKFYDSQQVLRWFTVGMMVSLAAALGGTREVALIAFPLCGFFASVMWSISVSLALNSVKEHHGTFSGILCTGIAGGAVVPLLIGGVAEYTGLRAAMMLLFATLAYVFSMSVWARPLVKNQTVRSWKELWAGRR